jgi:DNA replicative helicase MCM subunit Mcm2 (Cdc46/Mcm family)
LTLLSKNDEKSLLESMEQQTISSAKASVVTKLNARTTVIGACNPIRPGQIYDNDLDL